MISSKFRSLAVVVAMLAPLWLAACGSTVSATKDDATVTTRVKTALLNNEQVRVARIDVETFEGVVTLSGNVATPEERDTAIAIARKVNGVSDVKSKLVVRP